MIQNDEFDTNPGFGCKWYDYRCICEEQCETELVEKRSICLGVTYSDSTLCRNVSSISFLILIFIVAM